MFVTVLTLKTLFYSVVYLHTLGEVGYFYATWLNITR